MDSRLGIGTKNNDQDTPMMNDPYTELNDFLAEKFARVGRRFDMIDERFDKIDERFDGVELELRGLGDRVTRVEVNLEVLRDDVRLVADGVAMTNERMDRHYQNHEARIQALEDR